MRQYALFAVRRVLFVLIVYSQGYVFHPNSDILLRYQNIAVYIRLILTTDVLKRCLGNLVSFLLAFSPECIC
jgi:hypothetical protein